MVRKQQHLAEVVHTAGRPDGTDEIYPIIAAGLEKLRTADQAKRVEDRGDNLKKNPSVTDAGKCVRKVVLSLMNVPESNPPDTDTLLRFELGHAYEDAIARILEAYQGATYIREERVEIPAGETKITGRRDFDAVHVELSDAILELKSTNARAMGFLLKRGTPNDDHRRQLNLYLHATGKKLGYLVYLVAGPTKGEPVLHAWRVEYDEAQAWDDIATLVRADARAKERGVPPVPSEYKASAFPCSYCSYKDLCHGDPAIALAASLNVAEAV